jgi:DNA polymerase delta subunit 1
MWHRATTKTTKLNNIQNPLNATTPTKPNKGAHTRSISVATPSSASGGIMRFAKVKLTCLGCRAPLPAPPAGAKPGASASTSGSLCQHCKHREPELYARSLSAAAGLEAQFGRLWTQCQRCQGSLHQDVLCTSRDCPIFYRRKRVAKELAEAHATLARFTDVW